MRTCCARSSCATGIHQSERNRPEALSNPAAKPTRSQLIAQAMTQKAVTSGKVTAAMVAQYVLDAVRDDRFYIYSHPKALGSVQIRMEDVLQQRNPSDPLKDAPEMGKQLRDALRARLTRQAAQAPPSRQRAPGQGGAAGAVRRKRPAGRRVSTARCRTVGARRSAALTRPRVGCIRLRRGRVTPPQTHRGAHAPVVRSSARRWSRGAHVNSFRGPYP